MNQFYYSRTIIVPPEEGQTEVTTKTLLDSFNINKVLKSYDKGNGERIVLLDDMHKRWQPIEVKNKQGRVTAIKREEDIYQSEFTLSGDDVERFIKATQI